MYYYSKQRNNYIDPLPIRTLTGSSQASVSTEPGEILNEPTLLLSDLPLRSCLGGLI